MVSQKIPHNMGPSSPPQKKSKTPVPGRGFGTGVGFWKIIDPRPGRGERGCSADSAPSILLFCRYANALRTLTDPLGRQHLKRSRRGAVLFIQHHLLDSVVGRRLGRLGVFQLVVVHRLPTLSSSLEQCGRNTECTDYNTSITPGASAPPANRQDATVASKIARSFPQHTPLFS